MKHFAFFILLFFPFFLSAQDKEVDFAIEIDSIAPFRCGEQLKISYSTNGSIDRFSEPDMSAFHVVSGPTKSSSSMFSQQNGVKKYEIKQGRNYTLIPRTDGSAVIPAATAVIDGKEYTCKARTIRILPAQPATQLHADDSIQFRLLLDNISPFRLGQQVRLQYIANHRIDSFVAPDLTAFRVLAGPLLSSNSSTSVNNGVAKTDISVTNAYILSFPDTGTYTLPAATVLIRGKKYTSNDKTCRVVPPAQIKNITSSFHAEPRNPERGESFRLVLTYSQKPDEMFPVINWGKLKPCQWLPTIASDSSDPYGPVQYSWWMATDTVGLYTIPAVTVHFGGEPFVTGEFKIRVGKVYWPLIALIAFIGLCLVGIVWFYRKFRREGQQILSEYVVRTGRLNLTVDAALTHYGIVFYLLLIPVMLIIFGLYGVYTGDSVTFSSAWAWIIVIPMVLALLIAQSQYNKLRFLEMTTSLSYERIYKIIEEVSQTNGWVPDHIEPDCFIGHTTPGLLSGSWGEQIIVVFDNRRILINSICDLNKRSAVTSFGRTTKNIELLVEALEKEKL